MRKFQEKYEIANDCLDYVKSSKVEIWTTLSKDTSYRKFCQDMIKYSPYNAAVNNSCGGFLLLCRTTAQVSSNNKSRTK